MMYQSTRDSAVKVSAAQAITQGISREGGLFVPEEIPALSVEELRALVDADYVQRATCVLGKFLTDFSAEEVAECTRLAYASGRFRSEAVAPLHELEPGKYVLELWHGPTCAFKDMALQILPHLMRVSAGKTSDGKEIVILVATSGDTGKAALEGFCDAENTRIIVFYPECGVSEMQKLQMATQEGNNVAVYAIRGNFDDAQSGVKAIFTNPEIGKLLEQNGKMFSSANSINWGRLVPQIVYYVSAYCDLLKSGAIAMGDPINVSVPTGNFGDILAAYYAKKMGLPIAKLICASNRNRVLTDFIRTGTYDRNRDFYTTTSPSMDILISSNLERLLYDLCGRDDQAVSRMMADLSATGTYTVPAEVKQQVEELFAAGCCDDEQTADTICRVYEQYGYLCDTHTAVGIYAYDEYRAQTGDATPTVIASTANPYKFPASVLGALCAEADGDEFAKAEQLHETTGTEIPAPLSGLRGKTPRFTDVCDKTEMREVVLNALGIAE